MEKELINNNIFFKQVKHSYNCLLNDIWNKNLTSILENFLKIVCE